MTNLRTAAQQALEAMHCAVPTGKITLADWYKSITALKAALVEDAMQKFTDVNQELEAALAEPVVNQQLTTEPVQEPVQEHEDWCASVTQLLLCDPPRKAPCNCKHTAPPPRKPLTEVEISNIWDGHVVPVFGKNGINPIVFTRAIERAHGIT